VDASALVDPKYPKVLDEWETMRAVARGQSLARFGDGELKLMYGNGYSREPGSAKLREELLEVLTAPHPACLVGIPTMCVDGPKFLNWTRHSSRFAQLLRADRVTYYSAFVTRPDSAPWINCQGFAGLTESVWRDRRVVICCEPRNKLLDAVAIGARVIRQVHCPHLEAYAQIDDLERQIVELKPEVAVLSVGPTATCLANRLAARGVHTVDLGHAGGYLLKLLST
jgi:hypothetical protein